MAIKLLIGADPASPDYIFERADIRSRSLGIITSVDIIGSELAADELYADVDYGVGENVWWSPADYDGLMGSDGYIFATADRTGDITQVPYATPVWLMEGATVRHKMFFSGAERIGARVYSITAVSGVGLLERRRHMGGIYTDQTVATVLAEIIGDTFAYTVDQSVGSQQVSGVLLPNTARHNLHQLMFAMGISLIKGNDGGIQFVFLTGTSAGTIPADRIFAGGSVEYLTPATAVEVTEHSFFVPPTPTNEETLYDNRQGVPANELIVAFDGPYYDVQATADLTIVGGGATYAVVTGTGVLTGKPYTHNTKVLRAEITGAQGGEKVITSSDDLLVNGLNSMAVLQRLAAYHKADTTVRFSAHLDGEKAGQSVSFASPFGETASGFISQLTSKVGGFQRGDLKIITGYTPTGQGNYYKNRLIYTASNTYGIPNKPRHVRVVVIQGGTGGYGGTAGENGQGGEAGWGGDLTRTTDTNSNRIGYLADTQRASSGGSKGAGGTAGMVQVVDIETFGPSWYIDRAEVVVGAGGAGGSAASYGGTGSAGEAGTHTTIRLRFSSELFPSTHYYSDITSQDGIAGYGYVDPMTGDVYATPGGEGYDGGGGGKTDTVSDAALNGADGNPGEGVSIWHGGGGGSGYKMDSQQYQLTLDVSGGGGGGAAYGEGGQRGGDYHLGETGEAYGGDGGKGANATTPLPSQVYGGGGGGGNGGGGGGNGAGGQCYWAGVYRYTPIAGQPGLGGAGSAGGTGGPGVAIIYY